MADSLIVQSAPVLAFYDTARPAGVDLAWPRLSGVSELAAELRSEGQTETPSARITVDNGDGRLTGYLAAMPLRSAAVLWRDGVQIFRGVVVAITLAADALIELEA